ncbi:hypothetical protein [Curvibacter phage PCA1]|nr:hypothetical protein [Curvibacter phage PCA1]
MKTTLATIRKHSRVPSSIDQGKNWNEPVFYYFGQLLNEQWCDDVNRAIRHTGWFTNEDGTTYKDGSGKARGVVVTLPSRPGFPGGVHLAGYVWCDNDERVIWPDCFSDEDEAARYADQYAEKFADEQRGHDIKWNEARRLEDKEESKLQRLRECLALRNHQCFKSMRDEVSELVQAIKDIRETLSNEYAGVL